MRNIFALCIPTKAALQKHWTLTSEELLSLKVKQLPRQKPSHILKTYWTCVIVNLGIYQPPCDVSGRLILLLCPSLILVTAPSSICLALP